MDDRIEYLDRTIMAWSTSCYTAYHFHIQAEGIVRELQELGYYVYFKPHYGSHVILGISKDGKQVLDKLYTVDKIYARVIEEQHGA